MSGKLQVRGLSNIVLEKELNQLFAPHGRVLDARIIADPVTGLGTGAGVIEMSSEPAAISAAAALNGREYLGRKLTVTTTDSKGTMVESPASDVEGSYDAFVSRLDASGRTNVDRHVAACAGDASRDHLRLWKRLAGFLASLAPHSIRTSGQRAVQFYVADGKYRQQVFALEDLRDGKLCIYAPGAPENAVRKEVLRVASEATRHATAYQLCEAPEQCLTVDSLTAKTTSSAPDYYKHLLDWNRKAIRITLPISATAAQIHAAESLCVLGRQTGY